MEEFGWAVALLASPLGRALSGSVVTLDGGLDNWHGPWPPAGLTDDAGTVPTEDRRPERPAEPVRPGAPRARGRYPAGASWRAKCCGCTEAFQASRAGSIPVARLIDDTPRGVAQSGSAPGWGPGGRRFESCLPDSRKARVCGPFAFEDRVGKPDGVRPPRIRGSRASSTPTGEGQCVRCRHRSSSPRRRPRSGPASVRSGRPARPRTRRWPARQSAGRRPGLPCAGRRLRQPRRRVKAATAQAATKRDRITPRSRSAAGRRPACRAAPARPSRPAGRTGRCPGDGSVRSLGGDAEVAEELLEAAGRHHAEHHRDRAQHPERVRHAARHEDGRAGAGDVMRPSMSNSASPSSTRKTSSSRVWTWRGGPKPSGIVARKTAERPPVAAAGTRNSKRLLPYQRGSPSTLQVGCDEGGGRSWRGSVAAAAARPPTIRRASNPSRCGGRRASLPAMHLIRIDHVSLDVRDRAGSLAWYEDVLGLRAAAAHDVPDQPVFLGPARARGSGCSPSARPACATSRWPPTRAGPARARRAPGPPRDRLPPRAPPRQRLDLLRRPRRHGAGGDGAAAPSHSVCGAVVRFVFSVEDLARTRFAISPISELVHSLVALRDPSHAALHVPWLRTLSGRLDGLALTRAVVLLHARAAHAPTSCSRRRRARWAASRTTSRRCARRRSRGSATTWSCSAASTRARGRRPTSGSRIRAARCGGSRTSWRPTGSARSRRCGRGSRRSSTRTSPTARGAWPPRGRRRCSATSATRVRWSDGGVDVEVPRHDATVALGGRGLLLMPTRVRRDTPVGDRPRAVAADARLSRARHRDAVGGRAAPAPDGLARLLGATRAAVLADLAAPRVDHRARRAPAGSARRPRRTT